MIALRDGAVVFDGVPTDADVEALVASSTTADSADLVRGGPWDTGTPGRERQGTRRRSIEALQFDPMYEFDSVSVSTYEATSLAAKLTEKSGDGWEIVAIVPTGSDITAYVKRSSSSDSADGEHACGDRGRRLDVGHRAAATTAAVTASEPAGWGSAPESTTTPVDTGASTWGPSATAAPVAAAPATPSVPAGWYADPAGRYELRYWDGSAWTEHVSRAGQQYTDPPVA